MVSNASFSPEISLIVARSAKNNGIGYKGDLPWNLPSDLAYFNRVTTGSSFPEDSYQNAVIMGRLTWQSIPAKFRPLKKRFNIVVSSQELNDPEDMGKSYAKVSSMKKAIQLAMEKFCPKIFIVGGSGIYREAIESGLCDLLFITEIQGDFECDAFFPNYDKNIYQELSDEEVLKLVPWLGSVNREENGVSYRFSVKRNLLRQSHPRNHH